MTKHGVVIGAVIALCISVAQPGVTSGASFAPVVPPTARDRLDPAIPGTFQPTAAGNPESALFGSVRTAQIGKHLFAQFHEGIDIAALQRGARGLPMDDIRAVAAGRVGYINQQPGNSNYGNYVVLLHDDPLGQVYTLYAHLAAMSPDLRVGQAVDAGTVIGIMGHTPTATIPVARAHLHFEVGVVANSRFNEWFRAQRLKPDHGLFNGLNLIGINPLEFFRARTPEGAVDFRHLMSSVPVAFELLIPSARPLDYFRRYPLLWQGAPFTGGGMVLACSEDGVPLSGRVPSPDELRMAGGGKPVVIKADAAVLGRNGCRLVVCDNGRWRVGEKGIRWLEILTY